MRARSDAGSVSVEAAAALPLIAIAMLLVAQVGVVVSVQLSIQHAAREGARVAAITNDDDAAREAALRAGGLDAARAQIDIEPATRAVGDEVTVRIAYQPPLMPLVERFAGGLALHAQVRMWTERDG